MKASGPKKILKSLFGKEGAAMVWNNYTDSYRENNSDEYMKEFNDFLILVTGEGFPLDYATGWALSAMAVAHHKLCEHACNRELSLGEENLREQIEEALAKVFAGSPVTTGHQYDPRGRTLYLVLPSGKHSSWDGETWRIPTP